VPCITLRNNTERPVTIELGTNELMALDPASVAARVERRVAEPRSGRRIPPLWDGRASERIATILQQLQKQGLKAA